MSQRENALNDWLKQLPMLTDFTLTPLAGDASFRRYYRLHHAQGTYIVMDAPPEKESLLSFMLIDGLLREYKIHAPEIIAKETTQGFLILSDLGDTLLSTELTTENITPRYEACLDTLVQIQQCRTYQPLLPKFDTAHMLQEMSLFRTWFLEKLLGLSLTPIEEKELNLLLMKLALHLADQPQCFIHRDYHSRNLVILKTASTSQLEIGVLDFQDAMKGPFTYDVVSLLKDCYIQLKDDFRKNLVTYFYKQLPQTLHWSIDEFQQGLDWCGLQRHLKVLGVFSRLHLRDHKPNYLKDLPLTLAYVKQCTLSHPAFHPLYELIEKKISPVFEERQPA